LAYSIIAKSTVVVKFGDSIFVIPRQDGVKFEMSVGRMCDPKLFYIFFSFQQLNDERRRLERSARKRR